MVTKLLVHKHGDRKRCSHDSSWEDFFSGLVNLLDIYENYSLDINLDFPSAAILFNQLDITVSVLRSVSDVVANLSLPCTDQLQELCSCFSEIQLYRWNRMAEIGRRTTSIADLDPGCHENSDPENSDLRPRKLRPRKLRPRKVRPRKLRPRKLRPLEI